MNIQNDVFEDDVFLELTWANVDIDYVRSLSLFPPLISVYLKGVVDGDSWWFWALFDFNIAEILK